MVLRMYIVRCTHANYMVCANQNKSSLGCTLHQNKSSLGCMLHAYKVPTLPGSGCSGSGRNWPSLLSLLPLWLQCFSFDNTTLNDVVVAEGIVSMWESSILFTSSSPKATCTNSLNKKMGKDKTKHHFRPLSICWDEGSCWRDRRNDRLSSNKRFPTFSKFPRDRVESTS